MRRRGAWQTLAPSALPFASGWPAPKAMDAEDMRRVRDAFVQAIRWADEAGFDLVEVHKAHGYLLSSFISPLVNRREDEYGGSLENRMRFPLEVFSSMRNLWPDDKPMSVRVSASDWMADGSGSTPEETVEVARMLSDAGCGRADLAAMARPHLRDAYLTLYAAEKHGYDDQPWPGQYLAGKPRSSST